jgi:citronellol/citronellal dehydrogenase
MTTLKGRTAIITGASRGIGEAIALRLAADGANVVIAAKTSDPHPKLPGTIHTVAEAVEKAGGKALAVQVDVRYEDAVQQMVDKTVEAFGGIDILVNNASAIMLTDTESTAMKRYDLMNQVNTRGTFLCTKLCLPHLEKSDHAKVLTLSPPPDVDKKWLSGHIAYTLSKFGMSMCTIGWGEELREKGVAATSLWPKTTIATAAVNMLMGEAGMNASRTPEIMSDAAYEILATEGLELTGKCVIDEHLLRERGVTDFDRYLVSPGVEPFLDLYVEGNALIP